MSPTAGEDVVAANRLTGKPGRFVPLKRQAFSRPSLPTTMMSSLPSPSRSASAGLASLN